MSTAGIRDFKILSSVIEVSDIQSFFGCEAHENPRELYESTIFRKEVISIPLTCTIFGPLLPVVLPVSFLIQEAPSDPTFSAIMAFLLH